MEFLLSKLSEQPHVTIEYFVPDEHKEGGSYQTYTGNVKRIDEYEQTMGDDRRKEDTAKDD